jgi:hypothetical protein
MLKLFELISGKPQAQANDGHFASAGARIRWITRCGQAIQLVGLVLGMAGLVAAAGHDVVHALGWMVAGVALFLLGRIATFWERDPLV